MRKKICILLALLLISALVLVACGQADTTPFQESGEKKSEEPAKQADKAKNKEVYVWACQYNSLPLFVNNDYVGLDIAAEELGVEVKKIGPQNIDLPAFIAAIEQEIPNKPDGLMVVCWDNALTDPVNKAVEAGIPVATVDGDLPDSKRIVCVSTNWYELGINMANELAPYIKDIKGKVVHIGLPGNFYQQECNRGFADTIKKVAPNAEFVKEIYDSKSNAQEVTKTMSNLINSMPDLVAAIGSDSTAGPGIAQAIKEANAADSIAAVCIDAEPEHIKCVKEGTLKAALGQKRQLITYYGVKMLYDYNHSKVKFTEEDQELGITNIPTNVSTGFIIVRPDNVGKYIEATADKAK